MGLFNRKKIAELENRIKHLETTAKVANERIWKLESPPKYKKGDKVWACIDSRWEKVTILGDPIFEKNDNRFNGFLGYIQDIYATAFPPAKLGWHWEYRVIFNCEDVRVEYEIDLLDKKPKR